MSRLIPKFQRGTGGRNQIKDTTVYKKGPNEPTMSGEEQYLRMIGALSPEDIYEIPETSLVANEVEPKKKSSTGTTTVATDYVGGGGQNEGSGGPYQMDPDTAGSGIMQGIGKLVPLGIAAAGYALDWAYIQKMFKERMKRHSIPYSPIYSHIRAAQTLPGKEAFYSDIAAVNQPQYKGSDPALQIVDAQVGGAKANRAITDYNLRAAEYEATEGQRVADSTTQQQQQNWTIGARNIDLENIDRTYRERAKLVKLGNERKLLTNASMDASKAVYAENMYNAVDESIRRRDKMSALRSEIDFLRQQILATDDEEQKLILQTKLGEKRSLYKDWIDVGNPRLNEIRGSLFKGEIPNRLVEKPII